MNAPLSGHIHPVVVPMKPVFPDAREHRPRSIAGRLPAPVAAAYDLDLDRVPWKRLGPGVWHHRLALRNRSEGDLRLIRVAAGRAVPEHGHGGTELTLVIEGVFEDATGQYRRGDIQDVDDSIDHQPIVSPDGECICLIATERPARFKSLLGRLSQTWTGL
jgi:putative transcriptional regulator